MDEAEDAGLSHGAIARSDDVVEFLPQPSAENQLFSEADTKAEQNRIEKCSGLKMADPLPPPADKNNARDQAQQPRGDEETVE